MAVPRMNSCLVFAIFVLSTSFSLYCDVQWRTLTYVPAPESTLLRIQRSICIATNYTSSDGTFQLLPAACKQASGDTGMTCTTLARGDCGHCLEWMDHYRGIPVYSWRVMTKIGDDDGQRVIARKIYGGKCYSSHPSQHYGRCFCTNGSVLIRVPLGSHVNYFAWGKVMQWHIYWIQQVTGSQVVPSQ